MAKKVNFTLKQNFDTGDAYILLRFHFNSRRFQIATGLIIPAKYWSAKTHRVKETRDYPYYKQVNQRLNQIEAKTLTLFYDYQAHGIVPTIEQFKADWLERNTEVRESAPGLLQFIQQVIDEREAMKKPKGSLQVYRNCLGHLEAYQTKRRKVLTFDTLNQDFLNDFTAYLFNQGFADSYTHKIITTLKMFVRAADRRGTYKDSPLLKTEIGVKKREADNVYLNDAEIKTLFNLELEERLAKVRDLFLIGCLTGLRFSDFTEIRRENIQLIEHGGKQVECMKITTQKTKQVVVLPLTNPMLRAILERYDWKAPKKISNQKMNDYLKELAELAGFTQDIERNEYIAGHHQKAVTPKWQLITSHTARRSFATNAYKGGLPVPDIMKFTGHTTVASFMKYIKVTTEETAVALAGHDFFTGKSPNK